MPSSLPADAGCSVRSIPIVHQSHTTAAAVFCVNVT